MKAKAIIETQITNSSNTLFITDFHFDHKNIIRYCLQQIREAIQNSYQDVRS